MEKNDLNLNVRILDIPPQYPIDTQRMYTTEIEEKASFLIKGNLSGRTPALLRGTSTSMGGVEFPLIPNISLNEFGSRKIYPYNICTAVVAKTGMQEDYKLGEFPVYYGIGSVRLKVERQNVPVTGDCHLSRVDWINTVLHRVCAEYVNIFAFLHAYCKTVAEMTPESVCKFYGNSPCPRGANVSAPLYYEAIFPNAQPVALAAAETKLLTAFKKIDKPADIPNSVLVFSFPNQWGDANCKVAVEYDHEKRTKTLCPMTVFRQHGSFDEEMFRFLSSKKIPWSENSFQGKEIVITANVEFAFWNRKFFLDAGKLLITFPEAYGCYDFLDLAALNSASKVFLLVANFADETMAEACSALLPLAEKISAAMDDQGKFSVFVMSIAFVPIPGDIHTTFQLAEFINSHRPRVMETCIATSLADFRALCDAFTKKVQRKNEADSALRVIMEETPKEETTVAIPKPAEKAQTRWLIRSLIDQGGYIELIAQEKTGKTNFAVTLGYEIVTANQRKSEGLIPGRFWTVAKNAPKKIVYFDAELGEARFTVIRDRVKGAYLPKKSKEAAALDANFIYYDLFKDGRPYAKRENHQHVLDLIIEAEQGGTPGLVGLVILDTRRGFTKDQVGLEPQLSELIRKIRCQFNANVLVCHHMDEKNKAAGNTSVTTGKTGMIKMFRDYMSPGEEPDKYRLFHPVKFQLSTYGAFQTAFDTEPFYAKCEDGHWTLMEMVEKRNGLNTQFKPVEFDEKAIIKELVRDYKKVAKLTIREIAEYLGTTDDTLRERLK